MTSKPREGERRAIAATALDELPDRLAGQRSEGALEPPREDGRSVAGPVLAHGEVEGAVAGDA